jgi:hypothetical protein
MIGELVNIEHARDVFQRCDIAIIRVKLGCADDFVSAKMVKKFGGVFSCTRTGEHPFRTEINVGPIIAESLSDIELETLQQEVESEIKRRQHMAGDTPEARAEDSTYEGNR